MGCYINPKDMSKEEWLETYCIEVPQKPSCVIWADKGAGMLPVVLVQNPLFSAAAVAYNERELKDFLDNPNDPRPMRVFYALVDDLLKEKGLVDRPDLIKEGR